MSELEDRISAVLSDPEQLSRLTQMASRLVGGGAGSGADKPGAETIPAAEGALPSLAAQVMKSVKPGGNKPLLEAMAPYLDAERSRRLERALRLASTAKFASAALEQMEGLDGL